MAHEPSDDDKWTCECGQERVPDGEGGTICVEADFNERWPEWEMPDDAPTNDAVQELRG
jgi:hypothetical protein